MAQTIASPRAAAPSDHNPDEFRTVDDQRGDFHQQALRRVCIPAPRPRIGARIEDFAKLVGGDSSPLRCGPRGLLVGARLARARLVILGTACRRPLLRQEARDLQAITGDHVVVLRLEDGFTRPVGFTCDVVLAGAGECLENLSPWIQPHARSLWLAPADTSASWIRLLEEGPQFCAPPAVSDAELRAGLDAAQALLPATGPGSQHG